MLSKYSKQSKSAGETEDQFNKISKYSKLKPEETIADRVKLMPQNSSWNKNLNSKQSI